MKKILIFGRPGSGKSTLAEQLSKILDIPCYHLDKYLYTKEKLWVHISKEEFVDKISFIRGLNSFIIDGNNYYLKFDPSLAYIDTVLLLDMGAETCLKNVYKRKGQLNRPGFPEFLCEASEPEWKWNNFIARIKDWSIPPELETTLKTNQALKIYNFNNYDSLNKFIEEVEKCK